MRAQAMKKRTPYEFARTIAFAWLASPILVRRRSD
jgi:hypothetical protein